MEEERALEFGAEYGGWQKPEDANDPFFQRAKSTAWFFRRD